MVFKTPVRTEAHTKLKKLVLFPLATENTGLRKSLPFSGFEFLMTKALANKEVNVFFFNLLSSPLLFLSGSM
jgi:hypothetical protein